MGATEWIAGGALLVSGASFVDGRLQRRRDRERADERWAAERAKDTPQLIVGWNWNLGESGDWIEVTVTAKPGHAGTSVVNVGIAFDTPVALQPLTGGPDSEPHPERDALGIWTFPFSKEITPLEPGHAQRFRLPLDNMPSGTDPDTVWIPYATDVEGVRHGGPPMAIFGQLMADGWQPSGDGTSFPVVDIIVVAPESEAGVRRSFRISPEDFG